MINLIARSTDDALWLVRSDTAPDKSVSTSIRRQIDPVAGTWAEIAHFGGGVTDVAPVAGRLAVLGEAGDWQLVWAGGGMSGPTAPQGFTLRRLASSGDTLWATATRTDAEPALLKWSESDGWAVIGPLADGVDLGTASLGVVGETVWLTWSEKESIRVARFDGKRWAEPFRPLARGKMAEFVDHADRPVLAVLDADERISLWKPDGVPPAQLREPLKVTTPASLAMVGSTLRVFAANGDKIQHYTIDQFGRGQLTGPSPVAEPSPVNERPSEFLNVLLLALLTVAMLRTMRPTEGLPTLATGVRPAPLWRRGLAAVVDAVPLIASFAWVLYRFEGSSEALKQTPTTFYLPAYLGVLAYVAHITAAEAWRGQSVGKWIFGLHVVSVDGTPASVGQVLVRNLLRVVELSFFLIPCFVPLFTPAAQRIGDMAARTLVVTDRPQAVPPEAVEADAADKV